MPFAVIHRVSIQNISITTLPTHKNARPISKPKTNKDVIFTTVAVAGVMWTLNTLTMSLQQEAGESGGNTATMIFILELR